MDVNRRKPLDITPKEGCGLAIVQFSDFNYKQNYSFCEHNKGPSSSLKIVVTLTILQLSSVTVGETMTAHFFNCGN
jgi:hypothetical protein